MPDTEENGEAEPKKQSGMLTTILVAGIVGFVSGGLGFATFTFAPMLMDSPAEPEPTPPFFHEFGEVVANLDEGQLSRYLRIKLTLQLDGDKQDDLVKKIEEQKAVLRSWLNSYLSGKQMVDVRGAQGQNALRREIQNKFNTLVATDGFEDVQDVLFEEFTIQ